MTNFDEYEGHFKMCLVAPNTKVPLGDGWQLSENLYSKPVTGYNHGLVHEHNGTCAIDIDNLERTRELAIERNINIDMYLMIHPQIKSGVLNHGKLIYRLPIPMPSKKISEQGKDIINFRCIGNQDILPPSIHPDTNLPYEWIGDWKDLPYLPQEFLDWWMDELKPKLNKPTYQNPPIDDPGPEAVAKALNFCNPDCSRIDWITIGFSVHSFNPNYFDLWHDWSKRATEAGKYTGLEDCLKQWNCFKHRPDGITGKSLFFYAIKGGYAPTIEQALKIFAELEQGKESLLFEKRYVPDMPMSIMPPILREFAEEISYKVGSNPIVPIAAGLTAICTVASSQSRLELQAGYIVPPVVWNIVVAPPAAKKSPASKPMFKPFKKFEAEDRERYRIEAKLYEAKLASYAKSKKNYLAFAESAEWQHDDGLGQLPTVDPEPKPPVELRYTFTDATSQKVVDLLENRPQGMSIVLDEGKTWFDKICNPNGTEDRSFWTQSYEADSYSFDRVGRGTILLDNLAISAYVNIQPPVLARNMSNLEEDGLFQRFTPFIIPVDKCSAMSNELPDFLSKSDTWENLLRTIKSSNVRTYRLSEDAKTEFRAFEEWTNQKQRDHALLGSPTGFQSALGKMLGLCGRYAFVFHLANDSNCPIVPIERMKESIVFMKEYVFFTLRDISLLNSTQPIDEWFFDWIITGEEEQFTLAMIKKAARKQLEKYSTYEQQRKTEEALDFLEELSVIMKIERGANKTDNYAVNPTIREKYKERRIQVVKAKYRDKLEREEIVLRTRSTVKKMPVRGQGLIE